MIIGQRSSSILLHLYSSPLHRLQDSLKNKMKEQADKEEKMLTEMFTDANPFDSLLGKATDTAQPIKTTKETAKFLVPDNKVRDYDFKVIDNIYRKYPSALQLPVLSLHIPQRSHINRSAAKVLASKSEQEATMTLAIAGGYPVEYMQDLCKKLALSSLEMYQE